MRSGKNANKEAKGMGLETTKMFHILSNGKIKELTEKEYLKLLSRKGYLVGWVDQSRLLFSKGGNAVYLFRHQIQQIFSLFDNAKVA
jgi:hypothetical protein